MSNQNKITTSLFRIDVEIYHYDKPPTRQNILSESIRSQKISKWVKSFSYTKNISDPSGAFEIEVKWDMDPFLGVASGDWVIISYKGTNVDPKNNPEGARVTRCIGMIDRVARSVQTMSDGKKNNSYKIYGRDIGMIFSDMNLFINLYPSLEDTKISFRSIGEAWKNLLKGKAKKFIGSPDQVVTNLIKTFLANVSGEIPNTLQQFHVPSQVVNRVGNKESRNRVSNLINLFGQNSPLPRQSILSILSLDGIIKNLPGQSYKENMIMNLFNGNQINFWELLKECQNPVLNEMFIEMDPKGRPTFYFRQIPLIDDLNKKNISRSMMRTPNRVGNNNMNTITLSNEYIINMDLGFDHHDRFNLFYLFPKGSPTIPMKQYINETSIRRYGIKPHIRAVDYSVLINFESKNKKEKVFWEQIKTWNDFLYRIYNNNPYYEKGTITLKGDPRIRVGSNLNISYPNKTNNKGKDIVYSYYIEEYTDTYTIDEQGRPHYITTAVVSRGYNKTKKDYISLREKDSHQTTIGTSYTNIRNEEDE